MESLVTSDFSDALLENLTWIPVFLAYSYFLIGEKCGFTSCLCYSIIV